MGVWVAHALRLTKVATIKGFYVVGLVAIINLLLRRTLVRLVILLGIAPKSSDLEWSFIRKLQKIKTFIYF